MQIAQGSRAGRTVLAFAGESQSSSLPASVAGIFVAYFVMSVKGQFFIGVRSGDLVVASFGVLKGAFDQIRLEQGRGTSGNIPTQPS